MENIINILRNNNLYYLGLMVASHYGNTFAEDYFKNKITDDLKKTKTLTKIKLLCNWTATLEKDWKKMSKHNDLKWDNIEIIGEKSEQIPDYYVIINSTSDNHDPTRSIIFQMEPYMHKNKQIWGDWSFPNTKGYLKVFNHFSHYNIMEWHLSKTYSELMSEDIKKNKLLSTIISNKYQDIGHIKRMDFLKYIEENHGCDFIDIYGTNTLKSCKGSLPWLCKDDGLLPYKYTFIAENNRLYNYITEKLIDSILSECLCFYFGAPNVSDYIDSKAYIVLNLDDFEHDYMVMKKAINEDWWQDRIHIIRKEKYKILNELQFFPMIDNIIHTIQYINEDE